MLILLTIIFLISVINGETIPLEEIKWSGQYCSKYNFCGLYPETAEFCTTLQRQYNIPVNKFILLSYYFIPTGQCDCTFYLPNDKPDGNIGFNMSWNTAFAYLEMYKGEKVGLTNSPKGNYSWYGDSGDINLNAWTTVLEKESFIAFYDFTT